MKNATSRTAIRELDDHQSSRSRIDQDEFEIRRQFRIIKFKGLESRSRISNRNSRNRIEQRNSRSRIEQDIENFDDKFDTKIQGTWIRKSNRKLKFEKSNLTIDFEKSNRATKRKSRIQNSTSKYDFENSRNRIRESTSKFDFKIRHENFGSKQDTKTQTRIENFRANEKASRRTTDERREAHSHETRTHSHETAPERTPETHASNERLF